MQGSLADPSDLEGDHHTTPGGKPCRSCQAHNRTPKNRYERGGPNRTGNDQARTSEDLVQQGRGASNMHAPGLKKTRFPTWAFSDFYRLSTFTVITD